MFVVTNNPKPKTRGFEQRDEYCAHKGWDDDLPLALEKEIGVYDDQKQNMKTLLAVLENQYNKLNSSAGNVFCIPKNVDHLIYSNMLPEDLFSNAIEDMCFVLNKIEDVLTSRNHVVNDDEEIINRKNAQHMRQDLSLMETFHKEENFDLVAVAVIICNIINAWLALLSLQSKNVYHRENSSDEPNTADAGTLEEHEEAAKVVPTTDTASTRDAASGETLEEHEEAARVAPTIDTASTTDAASGETLEEQEEAARVVPTIDKANATDDVNTVNAACNAIVGGTFIQIVYTPRSTLRAKICPMPNCDARLQTPLPDLVILIDVRIFLISKIQSLTIVLQLSLTVILQPSLTVVLIALGCIFLITMLMEQVRHDLFRGLCQETLTVSMIAITSHGYDFTKLEFMRGCQQEIEWHRAFLTSVLLKDAISANSSTSYITRNSKLTANTEPNDGDANSENSSKAGSEKQGQTASNSSGCARALASSGKGHGSRRMGRRNKDGDDDDDDDDDEKKPRCRLEKQRHDWQSKIKEEENTDDDDDGNVPVPQLITSSAYKFPLPSLPNLYRCTKHFLINILYTKTVENRQYECRFKGYFIFIGDLVISRTLCEIQMRDFDLPTITRTGQRVQYYTCTSHCHAIYISKPGCVNVIFCTFITSFLPKRETPFFVTPWNAVWRQYEHQHHMLSSSAALGRPIQQRSLGRPTEREENRDVPPHDRKQELRLSIQCSEAHQAGADHLIAYENHVDVCQLGDKRQVPPDFQAQAQCADEQNFAVKFPTPCTDDHQASADHLIAYDNHVNVCQLGDKRQVPPDLQAQAQCADDQNFAVKFPTQCTDDDDGERRDERQGSEAREYPLRTNQIPPVWMHFRLNTVTADCEEDISARRMQRFLESHSQTLQQEIIRLQRPYMCQCCFRNTFGVLLLPCYHMLCAGCFFYIVVRHTCRLCNHQIDQFFPINFSDEGN